MSQGSIPGLSLQWGAAAVCPSTPLLCSPALPSSTLPSLLLPFLSSLPPPSPLFLPSHFLSPLYFSPLFPLPPPAKAFPSNLGGTSKLSAQHHPLLGVVVGLSQDPSCSTPRCSDRSLCRPLSSYIQLVCVFNRTQTEVTSEVGFLKLQSPLTLSLRVSYHLLCRRPAERS